MKHSIAVKFLAITLCALSVVGIVASGFGLLFMESYNLYNEPLEDQKQEQLETLADQAAWYHAQWHAAASLSNCPQQLLSSILYSNSLLNHIGSRYAVQLYEQNELVYSINNPESIPDAILYPFSIKPNYPIVSQQRVINAYGAVENYSDTASYQVTEAPAPITSEEAIYPTEAPFLADADDVIMPTEDPATGQVILPTEPAALFGETESVPEIPDLNSAAWAAERSSALEKVAGQEIVFSSEYSEEVWDDYGNLHNVIYTLDYYEGPTYEVKVWLSKDAALGTEYALMSVLYPYRNSFIPLMLVCLLTFAITLVYLFVSAGRTKSGEIVPTGLNSLPLDLYLLICAAAIVGMIGLVGLLIENYYYSYYSIWDNIPLCMLVLGLSGFGIALLVIGFLFAFTAQVKFRKGYWWRHSLCGWCLCQILRILKWLGRGMGYLRRGIRGVFNLLPVIWQWLLTAFLMVLVPVLFFLLTITCHGIIELFWGLLCLLSILADIALVCYGGYCFGTLLKGAKNMAQGNLNYKISTRYLYGCFRDFGNQLNNLAEGAKIAAERQMKSERMKTELITNVSHDIKTPLTSIINYVDLLKKPHSDTETALYLEVLDRQSQRLKKLIDDLMEMSKASTGNLTVELGQVDAAEAVNQALGEFADKLAAVNLTPVFRHPDAPVTMRADGRLVWRVLSNILSNAVKYALPDTRLYIDLMVLQGNAVLAIKNISRDQLNVNADELMERFVRGDASRNTEGSGLGLNIAKSLVELQHGQMHLMVDGDLFKVTLIFPCC